MPVLNTTELNETLDLLTHPYRRYVLYYLAEESGLVDVDTLATAIARWNEDHEGMDRSTDSEAVATALHHTHLPRLADTGVIEFGADGDSVELEEADGPDRFLGDTARIDGYPQPAADD